MANMSPHKVSMPEQLPNVRNKNFSEVSLGYTAEMAKEEAGRCLQCKNSPCVKGCPVNVQIPEFIKKITEDDIEGAYGVIAQTSSLPAVCGRVCPQERQCEALCVRGIKTEPVGIGRLERFAADYMLENKKEIKTEIRKNGIKAAVVGAGPAGLTCAGDLAKMGYDVTVFEAFHVAGGVLMYGIPQFRLPKEIVKAETEKLEKSGVKIELNSVIGRVCSIDELFREGFKSIFIGTGAGLPTFMNLEGENLNGVYSANEFLTRINLMHAYDSSYDTPIKVGRNVVVVGGGNVAMDAARSAKRLGAENVYIVYRRSEAEMPARAEEVHHAKEEGIIFKLLTNPISIKDDGNGYVNAVECVEMELGEADASGRRRPAPKAGSEHIIPADTVIIAIGQTPNPLIKATTPGLETQKWGGIIADETTGATSIPGVFAGGDAVTGAATVILAMGAGKAAAKAMDEYMQKNK